MIATETRPILILGATKGLGQAIAFELQLQGRSTIEVGSSVKDGEENNRFSYHCDLTNLASTTDFLKRAEGRLSSIGGFFWVAGRLLKGPFTEHNQAKVLEILDVNLRNPMLIVQRAWQVLSSAKTPVSFTVIASLSGIKARKDEAVYVATKHAQVGFTRSLGLENQNPNLRVSLFMPGGMKTGMWEGYAIQDYETFLDPQKVAKVIVEEVLSQNEPFIEIEIPRGSL